MTTSSPGDGDSVDQHKRFYDEYLSVMDMTAEFYLDTIQRIFQDHDFGRRQIPLARPAGEA